MSNLMIADTQESKFGLVFRLAHQLENLLPVYVISHKRSKEIPTLATLPLLREHAHVVVAAGEEEEYRRRQRGIHLMTIPEDYRGHGLGVGRARQFCIDTADILGQERILIIDDDMTSLNILYGVGGDKVSRAFARAVEGRREDFHLGALALFAAVSGEAFDSDPNAMIASPQNQNANRTAGASRTRWQTNTGGNPGLLQAWHVDRFTDRVGGIDLDLFNRHGDDIGALAQIVDAGGNAVKVPSIIGDSWDCETRSVIRTAEEAPALRQAEHDALMSLPLAPYVRTKTDMLDRPQWHSLDWRALARDGKVQQETTLWIDP